MGAGEGGMHGDTLTLHGDMSAGAPQNRIQKVLLARGGPFGGSLSVIHFDNVNLPLSINKVPAQLSEHQLFFHLNRADAKCQPHLP